MCPQSASEHTAVWTGSEMIVWGGYGSTGETNTGGRYNPSTEQLDCHNYDQCPHRDANSTHSSLDRQSDDRLGRLFLHEYWRTI